MKAYLRYEGITRQQYPQSPLQVEPKPLFTMMPRRKTAQAPFRKSLHQNKSPMNFDRQFVFEELRIANASLQEINKELSLLNESLQEQVQKLQESNKALQVQINQMTIQIDDLKINNRHLRSQDNSLHLQSKTFDQRFKLIEIQDYKIKITTLCIYSYNQESQMSNQSRKEPQKVNPQKCNNQLLKNSIAFAQSNHYK
ncbi:unnamed protein product [Paramecium sonneborni]|uniref:Uncharacterized protein n=1 Tax=Paramecium sonneborni TaxID=65129 RepID=A0A8S1L3C1_9CILI|nr:unnamed protein product [Paramecium sonneborni]